MIVVGLLSLQVSIGLARYNLRYLKGLGAGAAALAAMVAVRAIPTSDPLLRLPVAGDSRAGAFALIFVVMGIDAEDRHVLSTFLPRRRGTKEKT